MPKAPQLECGRAGTRLKVCRTPPPGCASVTEQPHVALDRCCSSQPPAPWPMSTEGMVTHGSQGYGTRGLTWSLE